MHIIQINYRMPIYFEGDDAQTMKQVAINFAKLILCQTDSQCETKVSNI